MAIPVISPVTSLNVYQSGEDVSLLLAATNTPTSWTCVGTDDTGMAVTLADLGLIFDIVHGFLHGAFKNAGFYNLIFTATNGDGTSAPLTVPVGIEYSGFALDATVGLEVDIETGAVTRALAVAAAAASGTATPVLYGKHGCQVLLTIIFKKQGQQITNMDLGELSVGLKQYEPEALLDLTDGTFRSLNGGFRVLLNLDDPDIANALGDYETDDVTLFNAIAEIRWKHYEQLTDGGDPIALISRSRNFLFQLERDVIPNP